MPEVQVYKALQSFVLSVPAATPNETAQELSYEAGVMYEMTAELAATAPEGALELVEVPEAPGADKGEAGVEPAPVAPAPTPAKPWAGNHKV